MRYSHSHSFWESYQEPLLAAFLFGLSRLNWHLGFLVFFALIPLFSFFQNRDRSGAKIITAGVLFATLYTIISLHWVIFTARHAMVPKWSEVPIGLGIWVGITFLFSMYFSILFGLIDAVWKNSRVWRLLAIIGLWVGFEWLQNFGDFRFPWHNLGYSLSEYTILIQVAEIGGVYLVSVLIIVVNWMIYKTYRRPQKYFILLGILMTAWLVYGGIRLYGLPMHKTNTEVAIVQPSIPQEIKWDRAYLDSTLTVYETMTEAARKDSANLVVYPEAAIPMYLGRLRSQFNPVQRWSNRLDVPIFTGFPHMVILKDNPHVDSYDYNSCTQFNPDTRPDPIYNKIALVPFGERTPWLNTFPFLWSMQLGQANFQPGDSTAYYTVDGLRYSPLICFEIAFPHLTCNIEKNDADFIVNLTNDGWFGHSVGTYQHAMMVKFRAIETRRQIYRAANSGISMIVLPTGRIEKKLGLFKRGTLQSPVYRYESKSLYCGPLRAFPLVLGLIGLVMGLFAWVRNHTISNYRALRKDY